MSFTNRNRTTMKFRYVIKNKHTQVVYFKWWTIKQIEAEGLNGLLDMENYDIIARDRFTGKQTSAFSALERQDIYENDIVEVKEGDKRKKGAMYSTRVVHKSHGFCLDVNRTKLQDFASLVGAKRVIGNTYDIPNTNTLPSRFTEIIN